MRFALRAVALTAAVLAVLFAAAAASVPASADPGTSVTSIAPGYGLPAGGTSVTLTGSGLTGATSVTFGTAAAQFTVVSDTQVTATSPPGTGTVPVTVTTPSGTAGTQFIYTPIQHVVVIYLENHSFDSLLGFWCDQVDSGAIPRADGCGGTGMPATVTLSNGAVVTPSVSPDTVPMVNHQTPDQVAAADGGKMDGWNRITGCTRARNYACVSGYEPSQEPNLAALAAGFAISDETFSMQDSASWFGHLYAVAASTGGFTGNNPACGPGTACGGGWGCDSNKVATWAPAGQQGQTVPSCIPDPSLTGPGGGPLANGGAFAPTPVPYVPTIMDRLNAAALPWRLYGSQCATETADPAMGLETCTKPMSQGPYGWATCPSFAECLYSQQGGMAPAAQFTADAKAGNLPAFSLVTPGSDKLSEHNGFSMTAGDNWLGSLVSAAENGPGWGSTAIFITWDDCGCFYDQVPPPPGLNADGTPPGPRVPLVIVSPYARPGFTDTTPTTFAGILAYTEQNFGLPPLGANDAAAYSFSGAFNYAQAPLEGVKMVRRPLPASAKRIKVTPALAREAT